MNERDLPIDRDRHALYTKNAEKCVQKLLRRYYDEPTAAALACWLHGEKCFTRFAENGEERIKFALRALGGDLTVDFIAEADGAYRDIWLAGPATRVFETDIDLC